MWRCGSRAIQRREVTRRPGWSSGRTSGVSELSTTNCPRAHVVRARHSSPAPPHAAPPPLQTDDTSTLSPGAEIRHPLDSFRPRTRPGEPPDRNQREKGEDDEEDPDHGARMAAACATAADGSALPIVPADRLWAGADNNSAGAYTGACSAWSATPPSAAAFIGRAPVAGVAGGAVRAVRALLRPTRTGWSRTSGAAGRADRRDNGDRLAYFRAVQRDQLLQAARKTVLDDVQQTLREAIRRRPATGRCARAEPDAMLRNETDPGTGGGVRRRPLPAPTSIRAGARRARHPRWAADAPGADPLPSGNTRRPPNTWPGIYAMRQNRHGTVVRVYGARRCGRIAGHRAAQADSPDAPREYGRAPGDLAF